jgi:hypothetical protein
MRVLVCGGRSYYDAEGLNAVLGQLHKRYCFSAVIHSGPLDPLTAQAPGKPGQALAALQARRLLVRPPWRGWGGQAAPHIWLHGGRYRGRWRPQNPEFIRTVTARITTAASATQFSSFSRKSIFIFGS